MKTPGAKLVMQYLKKKANAPSCGDCGKKLHGVCNCNYLCLSKDSCVATF